MALADAVQGANHTAQSITWNDSDGNAVTLTNATITGKIKNSAAEVRDIAGTLNITDGAAGTFTWTYAAADVATAGGFEVQFIATFADTTVEKTLIESWNVLNALDL